MAQEKLAEDEVLIIELVEAILGDRKLALAFCLVQVLAGADLKYSVAGFLSARDEEADGLEISLDVIATLMALAEVRVRLAVEVRDSALPRGLHFLE